MVLERVPGSLRGELTRWLIEPKAGVFVGKVSAMVRDRLWQKACASARGGACVLVQTSDTEQGFMVHSWGVPDREVVDFEGLTLMRVPGKS